MMNSKKRFKIRAQRVRGKISRVSDRHRVTIHKSNKNIYAQIISFEFDYDSNAVVSKTVASASTLTQLYKNEPGVNKCNKINAKKLGFELAKKAFLAGVSKVVLDRGGYKYHGVVKEFADALRSSNIEL